MLISASQSILTNRYQCTDFIQPIFLFSHNPIIIQYFQLMREEFLIQISEKPDICVVTS